MKHLLVVFHIPGRKLTQYDLDIVLESVERMACGLNKSGRRIFMRLTNRPGPTAQVRNLTSSTNDSLEDHGMEVDFVVKLMEDDIRPRGSVMVVDNAQRGYWT